MHPGPCLPPFLSLRLTATNLMDCRCIRSRLLTYHELHLDHLLSPDYACCG